MGLLAKYQRGLKSQLIEVEEWTRKVILKVRWIEKCMQAGKFLVSTLLADWLDVDGCLGR
jgi:hypothetical protein